jgi:hypothetical protein
VAGALQRLTVSNQTISHMRRQNDYMLFSTYILHYQLQTVQYYIWTATNAQSKPFLANTSVSTNMNVIHKIVTDINNALKPNHLLALPIANSAILHMDS